MAELLQTERTYVNDLETCLKVGFLRFSFHIFKFNTDHTLGLAVIMGTVNIFCKSNLLH